jgi:putative ABC transport system permease protein
VLADIRYALRLIRRTPVFTASVVLTIALAIGATTAIFSVVNAVLLQPLPFAEPRRLYQVAEKNDRLHVTVFAASVLNFLSWREQVERFDEIGAVGFGSYAMSGRGEADELAGFRISPSVMRILGLHAVRGRSFDNGEERRSAAPVAMIGEGLWRRRFGADASAVGQTVTLNGVPTTIIGIAPPELAVLTGGGEVWTPLVINLADEQRLNHLITVIGRVKRGVTAEQAQTEMDTIAGRVRSQYPEIKDWGVHVVPFHDMFVSPQLETGLWVLLAAVGFVLLIACANITSLLLARAAARQQEIAMRTALGASRRRLLRQMLVESLTFAILGGAGGLLLALTAVRAINRAVPPKVLPVPEIAVDGAVLLFAAGVPFGDGAYTWTPTTGLSPTAVPPDTAMPIDWRVVSPGYFETMGMTLVRGREFDERDDRSAPVTAVVSQAVAQQFWGRDDPIGRVIRIVAGSRDFTIIGVVTDVRNSALDQESPSM